MAVKRRAAAHSAHQVGTLSRHYDWAKRSAAVVLGFINMDTLFERFGTWMDARGNNLRDAVAHLAEAGQACVATRQLMCTAGSPWSLPANHDVAFQLAPHQSRGM